MTAEEITAEYPTVTVAGVRGRRLRRRIADAFRRSAEFRSL
jgi:hypothetical protein